MMPLKDDADYDADDDDYDADHDAADYDDGGHDCGNLQGDLDHNKPCSINWAERNLNEMMLIVIVTMPILI